ncbi:MAG: hypothetical protein RL701_5664 [Pseudomonadota bacterium]
MRRRDCVVVSVVDFTVPVVDNSEPSRQNCPFGYFDVVPVLATRDANSVESTDASRPVAYEHPRYAAAILDRDIGWPDAPVGEHELALDKVE